MAETLLMHDSLNVRHDLDKLTVFKVRHCH